MPGTLTLSASRSTALPAANARRTGWPGDGAGLVELGEHERMRAARLLAGGDAAAPFRRLAGALTCAAIISAIGGCGDSPDPLQADVQQRGSASCTPAPNPPGNISAWNSHIAFALDMFVNVSRSPLTIESVSLIDSHNLVLHGAVVYEMANSQHPMITEQAWAPIGNSGLPKVPGAVIPAGFPTTSFKPRYSLNTYEIVPDISLAKPGGGWAIGIKVTYKGKGQTYTVKAYTGYAIGGGPYSTSTDYCYAQLNAINAAFSNG